MAFLFLFSFFFFSFFCCYPFIPFIHSFCPLISPYDSVRVIFPNPLAVSLGDVRNATGCGVNFDRDLADRDHHSDAWDLEGTDFCHTEGLVGKNSGRDACTNM